MWDFNNLLSLIDIINSESQKGHSLLEYHYQLPWANWYLTLHHSEINFDKGVKVIPKRNNSIFNKLCWKYRYLCALKWMWIHNLHNIWKPTESYRQKKIDYGLKYNTKHHKYSRKKQEEICVTLD